MDDIFYCYRLFQSFDVAVQQQYNYLLTSKDEFFDKCEMFNGRLFEVNEHVQTTGGKNRVGPA